MKQTNMQTSVALRFRRMTRKSYGAFNTMHRIINIGTLTSLALACAYTSTVSAQNVAASEPEYNLGEPDKELTGVTVTASKTATPLNEATRLVTVISSREIAQTPARSIQELLNYVAGIDVAQRGAQGVQADVSIRGGSHEQIVILLNGINVSSSKSGHLSFDFPINLSDIERIEVLRGPSALIYGTGAFSGAINIITKHSAETSLYAKATAGMHRLVGAELRGAMTWGKTENSLSLSRRSSAGYRTNTDYEIYNALWQTRLNLPAENKMDLQLGYNEKKFGANSFYSAKYPNQYEHTQRMMASLRGDLGGEHLRLLPVLDARRQVPNRTRLIPHRLKRRRNLKRYLLVKLHRIELWQNRHVCASPVQSISTVHNIQKLFWCNDIWPFRKMLHVSSNKIGSIQALFHDDFIKRYIFHIGQNNINRPCLHQNAESFHERQQILYLLRRKSELLAF